MKVIVAPDSFKGCLLSAEVAAAIGEGVRRAVPKAEVIEVPMADGGEGTVQALVAATGGQLITRTVEDPLGEPVEAAFGLLGDGETAVIEMAAASGLPLVSPERRDPTATSTFGTGQLIRAALDLGVREIIIGIGGSATNDGGCGMAQALGVRFYDKSGNLIERVTGGRLQDIGHINLDEWDVRLADVTIRVACDVDNPLYGPKGAAYVYALQKGATPEQVELLDRGLRHLAEVIERDLDTGVAELPGAGAAGGLGGGLVAFCGGRLEPGVEIVIDAAGLRQKMTGAALCITGEGRLDVQTAHGKTVAGVARVAAEAGAAAVAVAGSIDLDIDAARHIGLTAAFGIMPGPMSLEHAMVAETARRLLSAAGENVARLFVAGRRSGRARRPFTESR
ncbi:MAG: glycerate kinase [Armatimonadetes bacterium]|nr:glycerate kinase [Armatimonadota bacterium]